MGNKNKNVRIKNNDTYVDDTSVIILKTLHVIYTIILPKLL